MVNNSEEKESIEKLLTKKSLQKFIGEFIEQNTSLVETIKITQEPHPCGRLIILRCEFFTRVVECLEDRINISDLSAQHDFIKTLLHYILNRGNYDNLEIAGPGNRRLDIKTIDHVFEVKTRTNVSQKRFLNFLMDHFEEMCKDYTLKRFWWFVMVYEIKSKRIYTESCLYYMIVFEIDAAKQEIAEILSKMNKSAMKKQVKGTYMVEEMQKQIVRVGKEDKLAEKQAILVPTKNYLIVENLRKQKMKEKRRAEQEKRRADALAKENEELKKQLKELKQKKG